MSTGRRVAAALTRFWVDDRGLSVFLALLVFVAFVLVPLVPPGSGRSRIGDVVLALLLLSGLQALGERKLRLVLMPVALAALSVELASWFLPVGEAWVEATSLVSLLLFLFVVLGHTLRRGEVTIHRIQGAVAAYLLLGIVWAYAYSLLAHARPGAFAGAVSAVDGPRAWFYFSFVALTTVGFGDIQPVHPVARSLASLEAVVGPLYLAILVARLVSTASWGAGRRQG
ncbi:MAG TPA: potassium channel family protein [Vicinamibacteria bacterium]|nr:potassium channel family protein [Vicinamibacteria bacterium]